MFLFKQLYRLGVINGFFFSLLMLGLDALTYHGFALYYDPFYDKDAP